MKKNEKVNPTEYDLLYADYTDFISTRENGIPMYPLAPY